MYIYYLYQLIHFCSNTLKILFKLPASIPKVNAPNSPDTIPVSFCTIKDASNSKMSLTTVRQAQMLPTNCSSQMVNLRLARATSPEVSCCVLAISGKLKRPACTVEPVNNK